jgi:hypothetical protein
MTISPSLAVRSEAWNDRHTAIGAHPGVQGQRDVTMGLNDTVTLDENGEIDEPVRTEDDALLQHYRQLHDGLSDMIEEGRLTEAAIPDDYRWLVAMLLRANAIDKAEANA